MSWVYVAGFTLQPEQSSDPFDARRTAIDTLAQVTAPGSTDDLMVGVENGGFQGCPSQKPDHIELIDFFGGGLQVSMSILKTRLSRCDHVIDARRSAGLCSCVPLPAFGLPSFPRLARVTNALCLLLGANTP